jgi:hypothetical protein
VHVAFARDYESSPLRERFCDYLRGFRQLRIHKNRQLILVMHSVFSQVF